MFHSLFDTTGVGWTDSRVCFIGTRVIVHIAVVSVEPTILYGVLGEQVVKSISGVVSDNRDYCLSQCGPL